MLIGVPHLVGAPHPETHSALAPPELLHSFIVGTVITNAVFWVVLGAGSAIAFRKLALQSSLAVHEIFAYQGLTTTNSARRRFVFLDRDERLRKETGLPSVGSSVRFRPELNFTELSTLRLLLGVSFACVVLWTVIATTIGV